MNKEEKKPARRIKFNNKRKNNKNEMSNNEDQPINVLETKTVDISDKNRKTRRKANKLSSTQNIKRIKTDSKKVLNKRTVNKIEFTQYREFLKTSREKLFEDMSLIKKITTSRYFIIGLDIAALTYVLLHLLFLAISEKWKPFSGVKGSSFFWLITVFGVFALLMIFMISSMQSDKNVQILRKNLNYKEIASAYFHPFEDIEIKEFNFYSKDKPELLPAHDLYNSPNWAGSKILNSSYSVKGMIGNDEFSLSNIRYKKKFRANTISVVRFSFKHKEFTNEEILITTTPIKNKKDKFSSGNKLFDEKYKMYGSKEQFKKLFDKSTLVALLDQIRSKRRHKIIIKDDKIIVYVYQRSFESPLSFVGNGFRTKEDELKGFLQYFGIFNIIVPETRLLENEFQQFNLSDTSEFTAIAEKGIDEVKESEEGVDEIFDAMQLGENTAITEEEIQEKEEREAIQKEDELKIEIHEQQESILQKQELTMEEIIVSDRKDKRKSSRVVEWSDDILEKGKQILETIPEANRVPTNSEQILRIFNLKPSEIKVVIVGTGPFQFENVSNGLAYGVNLGTLKVPSVQKNIFAEIKKVQGFIKTDETLESWEQQGVLLLHKYLTGTKKQPYAHKEYWDEYTTEIMKYIDENIDGVVWVFWGLKSIAFKSILTNENNIIIEDYSPNHLSNHRRSKISFVKLIENTNIEW